MPPSSVDRRAFLRAAGSLALSAVPACGGGEQSGAPDAGPDASLASSGLKDAGPPPDAGSDAGKPEPADAGSPPAPSKPDVDFPPWGQGTSSESTTTVLMFRGNTRRNFHGTGPLSASPKLKWRAKMGSLTVSRAGEGPRHWTGTGWTGQAVKWGRRVFVGGLDGKFYCWNAETGDVIWTHKTERMFKSSACFYKGNLYVGNVDNNIRCIDGETGELVWKHDTKHDCDSSPVVVDNILYVGGEDGKLHALDADTGKVHYLVDLGGHKGPGGSQGVESSAAIDGNDLYIANYAGTLFRVSREDGKILGRMNTGDDTDASPVIAGGYVYAGAEEKNPVIQCFDRKTEQSVWQFSIKGGFWSTPAVVGDKLYVGGDDAKLYCLDAKTGKMQWSFPTGRAVWSSPCVVDGKVVFGSYDGGIYMVDAATGKELWRHETKAPVLSTACIVDGRIYIGSGDGYFYCFA